MPTGQITQFDFNQKPPDEERSPEFWRALAREELFKNIWKQDLNVKKVKNMILFLGDGMSLSTVAAARILKRQKINHTGEEEALSFEKFPHTGLSKVWFRNLIFQHYFNINIYSLQTYCANVQVSDSSCTATAYLCGVKTNIFNIGISSNVEYSQYGAQ